MTFGEELREKAKCENNKAIEDFIEELKPKLANAAENGESHYLVNRPRSDNEESTFLTSLLQVKLPGVEVEEIETEYWVRGLKVTKYSLKFSW